MTINTADNNRITIPLLYYSGFVTTHTVAFI